MKQDLEEIPINKIDVESNYRKVFDEKGLAGLARSIRKNGVIQPIVVRTSGKRYILVAGERRLRASKLADKVTIPAVIREMDDAVDIIELQLVENIQKEGVHFMHEAYGISELREKGVLDVKEIAERIGKSDQYIYFALKLTAMSEDARRIAENGWISKSVAWEVCKLPNHEQQTQAANDLARTSKEKLLTASAAKHYIADKWGDSGQALRKKRVANFGLGSDKDYAANWKHHLVRFNPEQFESFKGIVRGRTQNEVLSEAVDAVMRETGSAVEIGGGKQRAKPPEKELIFSNA